MHSFRHVFLWVNLINKLPISGICERVKPQAFLMLQEKITLPVRPMWLNLMPWLHQLSGNGRKPSFQSKAGSLAPSWVDRKSKKQQGFYDGSFPGTLSSQTWPSFQGITCINHARTPYTNHQLQVAFFRMLKDWSGQNRPVPILPQEIAWPYFVGFGWPPSYLFANDKGRIFGGEGGHRRMST